MACRGILTGSGNTVDADVESLDALGATDQEFTSDDDGKVILKNRSLEVTDSAITANVPFSGVTEIPVKNRRVSYEIDFSTSASYDTYFVDATGGNRAVTLVDVNMVFAIGRLDNSGNTITLTPASGTINGAGSQTIASQWDMVLVWCDGSNWYMK